MPVVNTLRTAPTRLLSIAEAADQLNVSGATVRRLVHSGELRGIRAGKRQLRIDPASFEDYMRRSVVAA